MYKKIIILFLTLIILGNVTAFKIKSSNYETNVIISNGGNNLSSVNYQTEIISGIPATEMNSPSYSQSIGFFFCTPETCSTLGYNCGTWSDNCGGTLNCGVCSSGYTCSAGTCIINPIIRTPSGGGGSSISSCTYNWTCSEWYPKPCPQNGIQKRVCVNRGTCTGTINMPETTKTCIPETILPKEPLFDIFAKIPISKKFILKKESLKAEIELINLGNTTPLDVNFKYWIVNKSNNLITELQETRAISDRDKFQIEIILPANLNTGFYKFYAQIIYNENKTAMAQDYFEIVDSKIEIIIKRILSFPFFLIPIGIITIIVLILILRVIKKYHKNEKTSKEFKKRKSFIKKEKKQEKIFPENFKKVLKKQPRKRIKENKRIIKKDSNEKISKEEKRPTSSQKGKEIEQKLRENALKELKKKHQKN